MICNVSSHKIIIVLRLIRNFVPEDDPEKNNLEIVIEIIGQLLFIFGAIFLIHRVILYIPTYSKIAYGEMNLFIIILLILFILFIFYYFKFFFFYIIHKIKKQ